MVNAVRRAHDFLKMINAKLVADLRAMTGAGIVECKQALVEAKGDLKKAALVLRQSGALKAAKKSAERQTAEGVVHAYVHANEKIGALVELQCETDFVARTADFKQLAHELAMQVAATDPVWVSPETIPQGEVEKMRAAFMAEPELMNKAEDIKTRIVQGRLEKWFAEVTLFKQTWVKDDSKTVEQLINEKIATMGEKIRVARFCRFVIGPSS